MWVDEYQSSNCFRWVIELKENCKVIGGIDIVQLNEYLEWGEIGYCLSRDYWDKGIMTEALIEVINFLFEKIQLNRIQACHDTKNPASGNVMRKSGMLFEGIRRQAGKNKH